MDPKVSFQQAEAREESGVSFGGSHRIDCSNCRKPLMEIIITRPAEASSFKVVAICPYCGDKSFETPIKGGFAHLGIRDKNDNLITVVDYIDSSKEPYEFYIIKAAKS